MAGARSSCAGFQDQSFAFQTQMERKFKRMLSVLFVDKRKHFVMKLPFEEFNLMFSSWRRAWPVFNQKLAHENESFSSPPLNVWFRVAVQQITWYHSRTAYWLLIKGPIKAHWLMTLYGLRKIIYADVFWATKVQPLHSFFISKIDEHASELKRAREREPVALVIIKSPVVFIFIREIDDFQSENRSTTSKEKVEGLWTGYEGACYYFRENYKRSQVTMLTSRKVFLACLSLGQEEEMGGLVGIVFSFRINPTRTTYKNSCLYHYI